MAASKEYLVRKLTELTELVTKIYDGDERFAFPPHLISITFLMKKVEENDGASKDELEEMNIIYRILKRLEKISPITDDIRTDIEIEEYLLADRLVSAMKLYRENYLHDDGTKYSIQQTQKIMNERKKILNGE